MDKRLPLALFLSFLVLLAWTKFFAPPLPEEPPPATGAATTAPARVEDDAAEVEPATPDVGARVGEAEERTLELRVGTPGQPGSYLARFSNRGATLVDLRLGDYFDAVRLDAAERADVEHWVRLIDVLPADPAGSLALRPGTSAAEFEREAWDRALWSMRELTPADDPRGWPGVVFELSQGAGLRLEKRVLFEPDSYRIHVSLGLANLGLEFAGRPLSFLFTPAEIVPREAGDKYYLEPQAACAGQTAKAYTKGATPEFATVPRDERGKTRSGTFDVPSEVTRFLGVHNKYFAVLMRGADERALTSMREPRWRAIHDAAWAEANPAEADQAWRYVTSDALLSWQVPELGATSTWDYVLYAGPKSREALAGDDAVHEVLLEEDLGFFNNIARALLAVLGFFHGLTGNWGVAIILLTLCVRLLVFPINRRSQTAMARHSSKMKRLQPKIDELKKKYADDPAKQRQAQAELMQKEGAFPPIGGCLPLFLQFPIFIGLFQALRVSFDLRHAPFVSWIKDLSHPDQLLEINLATGLPFIGTVQYLNILPPLMVVLWIAQQATMPKPADEQAAKMQRMMMFMPAVFGVFLYNYAAGLSLYMITGSLLGIIEQHVIKRVWPLDDKEQEKKPPSGFMARMMERAAEAQKEAERRQRGKGGAGGKRR